jgi:hypothetical protein
MADNVAEFLSTQDVHEGMHRIQQEALERMHPVLTSAKATAAEILNKNVDKLATLSQFLPDGTINVPDYLNNPVARSVLGADNVKFLSNFKSIEKDGDHITFTAKDSTLIPLDLTIPGTLGAMKVKGVRFDNTFSFDLKPDANGHTRISNIQGINVEVAGPIGPPIKSPITEIDIDHDRTGRPQATVNAEVPITHNTISEKVPFQINPDGTLKIG